MDKQCELKIKSMQKFIPSLSALVEKLRSESNNRSEVMMKMQLVLKQLICPDLSVSIDELVESEETIKDFFHLNDCTEPQKTAAEISVSVEDSLDPLEATVETNCEEFSDNDNDAFSHIHESRETLNGSKYCKEVPRNEESTFIKPTSEYNIYNSKIAKNINIVQIDKSEEFVLPDLDVGVSLKVQCDSREIEEREFADEYPYETIETELIALELVNGMKDLKETNVSDPLNVEEFLYKPENMSNKSAVVDTNEDDDVQIVEDLNSPISIDSDEDLPSNGSGQQQLALNSDNLKKSVQKPTVAPKKVKKCLPRHCIVDTIELLDSSDDEKIDQSTKKLHSDNNAIKRNHIVGKSQKHSNISARMSNFLNAIKLQPVSQLLNGNPPAEIHNQQTKQISNLSFNGTSVNSTKERNYRRWLDNFLLHFSKPTQLASQSSFVLLQRVLKNKTFHKIKEARINLNNVAQSRKVDTPSSSMDVQLLLGLRNIFYNTDSKLTEMACRFCEFATNKSNSKTVVLTTDVKTGRATSCTRLEVEDVKKLDSSLNKAKTSGRVNTVWARKKQRHNVDEYTPSKTISIMSAEDTLSGERKRSLRTNRGKRYDNNFTYNEDQEEEEDYDNYLTIKQKIEQKRLEAELRRKTLATSFENAFIQYFSKSINKVSMNGTEYSNIAVPNSDNRILSRITAEKHCKDTTKTHVNDKVPKKDVIDADVIICSDESDNADFSNAPKNTNRLIHMMSKNHDICVLCGRQVQRIVHHYVNYHRDFEVYTARLSPKQLQRFELNVENISQSHMNKNGQTHFEAKCAFCQKRSRLMLSYWYQHFTMHTGEYAYRCSVCGVRKPTKSLLQAHINISCLNGGLVEQDFKFDTKSSQIEACICTLCRFVQLDRSNVVRHLQTQHGLLKISPKHIKSVVILKTSPKMITTEPAISKSVEMETDDLHSTSSNSNLFSSVMGQEELNFNDGTIQQFNYDDDSPCDDISFMICGMLDVQMKTE